MKPEEEFSGGKITVKGKIVVTKARCGNVAFIYEDDILSEIHPFSDESKVGNMYVAVVDNIVDNLKAAFLRSENGEMLYYSLEENEGKHIFIKHGNSDTVKKGDWLLVQVIKDSAGSKKSQATADISMKGRYSVINRTNRAGVSRRIQNDARRDHLKQLYESMKIKYKEEINDEFGVIFRSAAENKEDLFVELDAINVLRKLKGAIDKAYHENAGTLIYRQEDDVLDYLEDIRAKNVYSELTVVTDIPELYEELEQTGFAALKEDEKIIKVNILLHNDKMQSLRALYNIDRELGIYFGHKIYLKSGGYLFVDITEALTVIDVNTGKDIKGSNIEAHMTKTNIEAAEEIARIVRVRNISGIIIVDFINMKKNESNDSVISHLKQRISRDRTKCFFVDMTDLGLAELTRQKGRRRFELDELLA